MFSREDVRRIVGDDVMNGKDHLMTPDQVAAVFRVDAKTTAIWANTGRLGSIRTPAGHHRFRASEVNSYLAAVGEDVEIRQEEANPE